MPFRNAASEAGRITFTRASAARIANAVQVVENQRPAAQPLTFEPFLEKPHIFRVGTVASAWAKGSQATVTLSRSGRTVAAQNLLVSLPSARTVNIAKDGTAWYLVSSPRFRLIWYAACLWLPLAKKHHRQIRSQ